MKYSLSVIVFLLFAMFGFSSSALASCSGPSGLAGNLIYNAGAKVFQYCNDTKWIELNKPGSGSGGCSGPTALEGGAIFNSTYLKLQGCAGNVWKPLSSAVSSSNGGSWVKVSMSFNSACGIRTDGTAWCWGTNESGQLGNTSVGQYDDTTTPVPVNAAAVTGGKWIDISAGDYAACGIRDDGTLWCWGNGGDYTLANGASADKSAPTATSTAGLTGTAWTSVSLAKYDGHACGLRDDGTAWCWGQNSNGQVGNNTTTTATTPALVLGSPTGTGWVAISSGDQEATCGIRNDGTLWCWGNASYKQLACGGCSGNKKVPNATTITGVTGSNWTSLSMGGNPYGGGHSCAIRDNGTAWCWGDYDYGRDGDGTTSGCCGSFTTPHAVVTTGVSGSNWVSYSAGNSMSCGIRDDGTLWCHGYNGWGDLGTGDFLVRGTPTAVLTTGMGGSSWSMVSAGEDSVCGVRNNGAMYCFGRNNDGQLANGKEQFRTLPVQVSSTTPSGTAVSGSAWTSISLAGVSACGVRDDGKGYCWGGTPIGYVNGDDHALAPTAVDLTTNSVTGTIWTSLNNMGGGGCGLRDDGSAWCFSDYPAERNGNGAGTNEDVPAALSMTGVTGTVWTKIVARGENGCGIRNDGTLYCWGNSGSYGAIGDGSGTDKNAPTLVSTSGVTGSNWIDVSPSDGDSTCGIRDDGTGYCWGRNDSGQIGNNTTTNAMTPAAITVTGVSGTAWTSIKTNSTTCGLRDDGSLWCWGGGGEGEHGAGDFISVQKKPLLVNTANVDGAAWTQVDVGFEHVCALRDSGTMYCWGSSDDGSLGIGDGMGNNYPTPQRVSTAGVSGTKWTMVQTGVGGFGSMTSCGLRDDGTAWCWGDNDRGQLGSVADNAGVMTMPSASACASPIGLQGQLLFNTVSNRMELCNGIGWVGLGPMCVNTPSIPSFTDLTAQAPVTAVTSNIVQVSGLNCAAPVSVAGTTAQYEICADAACSTVIKAFGTSASTVTNGQYVQLKQTKTANTPLTAQVSTLTIGSTNATWSVTTQDWKYVFLSSAAYTPGTAPFTNYASGDTICGSLAAAQSLPGTYKAWLSTSNAGENPAASFASPQTSPYRLPNTARSQVFSSLSSLLGGASPATAINVYETGATGAAPTTVWTSTLATGAYYGSNSCTNWTGTSGNGRTGSRTSTSGTWTTSANTACTSTSHLYCFQQ